MASINISVGFTAPASISVGGDDDINYILVDSFGDSYNTNFNPSVFNNWTPGVQINIRIPFYHNDIIAAGLAANASLFNIDLINNSYLGNGLLGGYFEYKFRKFSGSFIQRLAVLSSFGVGMSLANGGGKLESAVSGDPGFYNGTIFHKPGSDLGVQGNSNPVFGFTLGVKHLFSNFSFIEAGYSFIGKTTIDKFELSMDGKGYILSEKQPKPLNISNTHMVYVLIGIGN